MQKRIARPRGRELSTSDLRNEPGTVGLDDAFETFILAKMGENVRERTLMDYRSYWRYFREWLAAKHPEITNVNELTTELVREYVGYMLKDRKRYEDDPHRKKTGKPLSPVTVKSRLRAVQTMCAFWVAEGLMSADPAAKVKPPKADVEDQPIITDDQIKSLLSAIDTKTFTGFRNRTLIELLADTGLRISEAIRLREEHFDFMARCIRLPGAMNKNRKPRVIPVSAGVLRNIRKLIEENYAYFDTDYVFISSYGDPLTADRFRKDLRKYATRAGLDPENVNITPHRFRDYFITNYLLNGGDLFTLQRIVAHADIKTTQGYVKVNEEALRDGHAQYSQLAKLGMTRRPNSRRR